MSISSNGTAIKRFTYDWLIRFAELHPFEIPHDFALEDYATGPYDPHLSKYAAISPLFTTLITRYMPFLYFFNKIQISEDDLKQHPIQTTKKCKIYVGDTFMLENLTPGTVARLKNDQILFSGRQLWIPENWNRSILTSDELKYLLKFNGYDVIHIEVISSDPIMFSEIWPQLAHCRELTLIIENIVYDENVLPILRENRVCPTESMLLWHIDMPNEAVLEMVDFLLSLEVRPSIVIMLKFLKEQPASFSKTIIDRIASSGVSLKERLPLDTYRFNLLRLEKDSFSFRYEDPDDEY